MNFKQCVGSRAFMSIMSTNESVPAPTRSSNLASTSGASDYVAVDARPLAPSSLQSDKRCRHCLGLQDEAACVNASSSPKTAHVILKWLLTF